MTTDERLKRLEQRQEQQDKDALTLAWRLLEIQGGKPDLVELTSRLKASSPERYTLPQRGMVNA
jgi:hypothetical protein